MQGGVKLLFTSRMGTSVLKSSKDRKKKNPQASVFLKNKSLFPRGGETSDSPSHRSVLWGEYISD